MEHEDVFFVRVCRLAQILSQGDEAAFPIGNCNYSPSIYVYKRIRSGSQSPEFGAVKGFFRKCPLVVVAGDDQNLKGQIAEQPSHSAPEQLGLMVIVKEVAGYQQQVDVLIPAMLKNFAKSFQAPGMVVAEMNIRCMQYFHAAPPHNLSIINFAIPGRFPCRRAL